MLYFRKASDTCYKVGDWFDEKSRTSENAYTQRHFRALCLNIDLTDMLARSQTPNKTNQLCGMIAESFDKWDKIEKKLIERP